MRERSCIIPPGLEHRSLYAINENTAVNIRYTLTETIPRINDDCKSFQYCFYGYKKTSCLIREDVNLITEEKNPPQFLWIDSISLLQLLFLAVDHNII